MIGAKLGGGWSDVYVEDEGWVSRVYASISGFGVHSGIEGNSNHHSFAF